MQEKRRIVTELLETRPSVFLARFGSFLSEDHLVYFEDVKGGANRLRFIIQELPRKHFKFNTVQYRKILDAACKHKFLKSEN